MHCDCRFRQHGTGDAFPARSDVAVARQADRERILGAGIGCFRADVQAIEILLACDRVGLSVRPLSTPAVVSAGNL